MRLSQCSHWLHRDCLQVRKTSSLNLAKIWTKEVIRNGFATPEHVPYVVRMCNHLPALVLAHLSRDQAIPAGPPTPTMKTRNRTLRPQIPVLISIPPPARASANVLVACLCPRRFISSTPGGTYMFLVVDGLYLAVPIYLRFKYGRAI
jgi:hypothetical protein